MKLREISISAKYGKSENYETVQFSQAITVELGEKEEEEKARAELRKKLFEECKRSYQEAKAK